MHIDFKTIQAKNNSTILYPTYVHTNMHIKYTQFHIMSCTCCQGLGCLRLTKHYWRAYYIRTSLRQCQGDRSHPKAPPVCTPCLFPTSRASWEGCPSAAYISSHKVQRGLQTPADIQLKSFIFPSFALPP